MSTGASRRNSFIRIADIIFNLTSDAPDLKLGLEGAVGRFLVDEAVPDVNVNVLWGDLSKENGGRELFDSGRLWQLYFKDNAYRFRFTSEAYGEHPYKVARFNPDFTSGEVYLHRPYFNSGQAINPLEYPLDELMMMNLLARGRGIEIHSCGVVDSSGRGYLFVGQSGAGKTTTARLWEKQAGVKILSDDRIILRKSEEGFWMYGTPWHGEAELACPDKAPLTHIFFLRQSPSLELTPQSEADASARLFACGFPPFHDPEGVGFTLSFLEDLTKNIPAYKLGFIPDRQVVDFVRQQTK